jgi:hypothetical protein
VGGNGSTDLTPSATVTARVVEHVLGEKIRIGKYKRRTGYRHHAGFRSRLTQIEIESIGAAGSKAAAAKKTRAPKAEAASAPATPAPEGPPVDAPAPEEHARTAHPPKGYEDMTVAQIAEAAPGWRRPNLEAALEYEREHASRKGALAALERALAEKEGEH